MISKKSAKHWIETIWYALMHPPTSTQALVESQSHKESRCRFIKGPTTKIEQTLRFLLTPKMLTQHLKKMSHMATLVNDNFCERQKTLYTFQVLDCCVRILGKGSWPWQTLNPTKPLVWQFSRVDATWKALTQMCKVPVIKWPPACPPPGGLLLNLRNWSK